MKALDNVKTDDLNDEQKRLLSELIKNEMMQTIETAVKEGKVSFADTIKNYLKEDEEEDTPPPTVSKKK
ncbi:MAG: hypothetical protein LBO69_04900 [Ignavibacteria bacterium]|jgi:hypothetical protein|nr:hypothetical protein [Ignavibacteria bacterium]